MKPLWHRVRERVIHGLFDKLTFIWSYGRYRLNNITIMLNNLPGPIFFLWLSKVLGDERCYTYNVFSRSVRPYPIDKNRSKIFYLAVTNKTYVVRTLKRLTRACIKSVLGDYCTCTCPSTWWYKAIGGDKTKVWYQLVWLSLDVNDSEYIPGIKRLYLKCPTLSRCILRRFEELISENISMV